MSTPVFWLERTETKRVNLRRWHDSADVRNKCPVHSYHNSKVCVDSMEGDAASRTLDAEEAEAFHDGWGNLCDCGYAFLSTDSWQVFYETVYVNEHGRQYVLSDLPVGAMWDAEWMTRLVSKQDGICLMVQTPGGEWCVDSRASNCTSPKDNAHKCWVRHGDPRDPQGKVKLHVDKKGVTCLAGGGSILCGSYHGFLKNGALT